jgi:hypothetical protein
MRNPPTDLEILEEIYQRYYSPFASHDRAMPDRVTKNYVPIDIRALAKHFRMDPDIIFGRLYYHLNPKFSLRQDDGSRVPFFEPFDLGSDRHAVQFPLLAAVIAGMREDRNRYLWSTGVAMASFVFSIVALVISLKS